VFSQILKSIDPEEKIKHVYCQDQCIKHPKGLIKDVALCQSDLSRTVIVDHQEQSVSLNRDNALILDPKDTLEDYLDDLLYISEC
jgi:TFIIF-interacting CTD phosphatase-like protein